MSCRRAASVARQLHHRLGIPVGTGVDVIGIAEALGMEIVERDLGTTSALLLRREGRAICVVNQSHFITRKRFSIAHEIGHFLLHPPKEAYDRVARDERSSEGVHREEVEANAFAAELLMPAEQIRKQVCFKIDLFANAQVITDLATQFEVSPEAMTHRLTNLGLLRSDT